MRTITLTRGLPASGKSTWAREQVEQSNGKIVRVNMDDIRAMLNTPYSKDAEELALQIQDKAIVQAIKAGKDVIVDNTHIEKKMPVRIKKLFDGDVLFKVKNFDHVPVKVCFERNANRIARGERGVPEDVITRMHNRINKWVLTEDFMNDVTLSPQLEYDPELPKAVVFDIDGTLAKHVSRSPYDYSRVLYDGLFNEIAMLTRMYSNLDYTVLIMSGRPGEPRIMTDTLTWLSDANIYFDYLYMRAAGDMRNDADVKQEMVDEYIRGKYSILLWFDDRDRVVRRLRKLGIKVAQVAEGDF